MRRQHRAPRVARGAVAASVATFVALLSHVSSGGAVPGWIGVVVPLALSLVVCTALAGRRLSAVRLTIAVALSQVMFHTLFVLGTFELGAAGHVHGATMPLMMTDDAGPALAPDATMWLGHAVAAVATAVALHRGERAFAQLLDLTVRLGRWMCARVQVVVAAFGPPVARRVFAEVIAVVRPTSVLLAATARRRGPPLRTV